MEKLPDSVWRALEYVETFGLMIRRGAQGNCAKIMFNPSILYLKNNRMSEIIVNNFQK